LLLATGSFICYKLLDLNNRRAGSAQFGEKNVIISIEASCHDKALRDSLKRIPGSLLSKRRFQPNGTLPLWLGRRKATKHQVREEFAPVIDLHGGVEYELSDS